LLEVDHAEAVQDRPRRVPVDDAADGEVAQVEAEPDGELPAEVGIAARQNAPARCEDGAHPLTLPCGPVPTYPELASDIGHFDLGRGGRLRAPKLGIPVVSAAPHPPQELLELTVGGAPAERRPQVVALDREEAGVEPALGREPCA